MIECTIKVEGGDQSLEFKGAGNKSEILMFIGMVDELKHRILKDVTSVDDGTEHMFGVGSSRGHGMRKDEDE